MRNINAVVYPASGSPKNIGPPDEVEAPGELVWDNGLVGVEGEGWLPLGGNVSQERVRKQDCRIMEKELGWRGSWVEV